MRREAAADVRRIGFIPLRRRSCWGQIPELVGIFAYFHPLLVTLELTWYKVGPRDRTHHRQVLASCSWQSQLESVNRFLARLDV